MLVLKSGYRNPLLLCANSSITRQWGVGPMSNGFVNSVFRMDFCAQTSDEPITYSLELISCVYLSLSPKFEHDLCVTTTSMPPVQLGNTTTAQWLGLYVYLMQSRLVGKLSHPLDNNWLRSHSTGFDRTSCQPPFWSASSEQTRIGCRWLIKLQ